MVGLLSTYPTMEFLSWSVREAGASTGCREPQNTCHSLDHWELVEVVLIILCAALMAKGVGYLA